MIITPQIQEAQFLKHYKVLVMGVEEHVEPSPLICQVTLTEHFVAVIV